MSEILNMNPFNNVDNQLNSADIKQIMENKSDTINQTNIQNIQNVQPIQPIQNVQVGSIVQNTQQSMQKEEQAITPIIAAPPKLAEGQYIICQMTPGTFDSFIKVLSLLDEKNIINITNSQILQLVNNNTAILQTNIKQLCNNTEINLHILQPKTNIKLFKAIKDNNDVFIIDDTLNKRFLVISGDVRIWLPKQIEEINSEVSVPNFNLEQFVGQAITITKEERNKITTLINGEHSVNLLIKNNQLIGYSVPEKVEACFKQFSGEHVSESDADLKLISSAFLSIPSDGDTLISLANQNGNYWLISKVNTAMVEIIIIESLQIAQNDVLLL